jgi:hypothetical protein
VTQKARMSKVQRLQVCVTPTQVRVNPTQVCVYLAQVCVNPTQGQLAAEGASNGIVPLQQERSFTKLTKGMWP